MKKKKNVSNDDICFLYNKIIDKIAYGQVVYKNCKYLLIDEKYFSGVYICDYPRIGTSELIRQLMYYNSSITISMFCEQCDTYSMIKKLTYYIGKTKAEILTSTDVKQDFETIKTTNNDALSIRRELQINNEKMYNFYLYISVCENSKEELYNSIKNLQSFLYSLGFISKVPYFRHIELLKASLPFINNNTELKCNSKRNMITKTLKIFYPFISTNAFDKKGIIFGYDKSVIIVDRFNKEKYFNSNMCVFGTSGAGKSYYIKLQILRNSLLDIRQYIIDPEGEYHSIAKEINAEYVTLGGNSNCSINIFDIYDDEKNDENILENKIQKLLIFFTIAFPNFTEQEKSILEECIIKTYLKKGISFNKESIYEEKNDNTIIVKNEQRIKKQMPTFSDLYNTCMKEGTAKNLAFYIKKFVSGSFKSLNGNTNISKSKKAIFINLEDIKEENMDIYLFVIIELFWNLVKEGNHKKIIYIDEVWKLMGNKNGECSDFIVKMFKTIRKYNGAITALTQDISDLIINDNVYGKAIINNSHFKTIFKLDIENIQCLEKIVKLTDKEKSLITNLVRGQALLKLGQDSISINVISSKYEQLVIVGKESNY